MSRVRMLIVTVLALAVVVVVSVPAGASVHASNAKFCKAVSKINSSTGPSTVSDPAKARALAKSFRSAAKTAPSKVKSAMNAMADYFQAIGNAGSNPAKLATALRNIKNYTKAATTFVTYETTTCITTPTTTP